MRKTPWLLVEKYRRSDLGVAPHNYGDDFGVFVVAPLRIIVSSGLGWEHVSVSLSNRCPTWDEMCKVKDLFWDPEEVVMQLHPRRSKYVNRHPHCLHLWRPTTAVIPEPDSFFV